MDTQHKTQGSSGAVHRRDEEVYHDHPECPVLAEVVETVLIPGTGGKRRCSACARLARRRALV